MSHLYILWALFISFCWGAAPVIHKEILKKIQRETIMVVSAIAYFCCMVIYAVYNRKIVSKDMSVIEPKYVFAIAVTSIFTGFVANILYYYVLKDHESSIISALIYSSPAFTLALALLFFNERISLYGLMGILFILLGVVLVSFN
jgi:uncharacterized membrane protein